MYSELVMLYKNRGEHRKALELLREHAKRPTGSMKGHFQTLMYLQRLGGDYADLVFEFSPLVIKVGLDMSVPTSIFNYLHRLIWTMPFPYLLQMTTQRSQLCHGYSHAEVLVVDMRNRRKFSSFCSRAAQRLLQDTWYA